MNYSLSQKSLDFDISAKPFLKWAGGKQQLIGEIEVRLPLKYQNRKSIPKYIEPFVGGGALFFYLKSNYYIEEAAIIDINPDLICCFKVVQKDVNELINRLENLQTGYLDKDEEKRKAYYYKIRSEFNEAKDLIDFNRYDELWFERASQMIFLNRTCFNGLYRQNSKGEFNVPQGSYVNPLICQPERLFEAHKALQNTKIILGEFELASDIADKDTFIYYDPPYRPLDRTSSFNSYAKDGFDDKDQIRLARQFKRLSELSVPQMLSNSDPKNNDPDDDFFDDLYQGYNISRVKASRMINCNGARRGQITELLITNY